MQRYQLIQTPKGPSKILVEESLPETKVEAPPLETKAPVLSMSRLTGFNEARPYTVRIASPIVNGAAAVAGVASAKVSWDPTSTGQFSSFASLFSEYKVKAVIIKLWTTGNALGAADTPLALIVASDPGALVSTPTFALAAESMKAEWYNGLTTAKRCISHLSDGSKAPVSPLTADGFAKIATSWTGQTLIVADSCDGTATSRLFNYQIIFDIVFRCRA